MHNINHMKSISRQKRGNTSNSSFKSDSLNKSGGWLQKQVANRESMTSSLPSIHTEWVRKIASPSGLIQTDEPVWYRKEEIIPDAARSKLVNIADRYSQTYPPADDERFVKFPRLSMRTGKHVDSDGEPDLSLRNINERRAANRTVLPYNCSEQSLSLSKIPSLELNIVTGSESPTRLPEPGMEEKHGPRCPWNKAGCS
jgi:hypothetical protein